MHLFLADETNKNPQPGQFFLYGGLVLNTDRIPAIHSGIAGIRKRFQYAPGANFKFTNQQGIDPATHATAKAEVLKLLAAEEAELLVTVVHQSIIARQEEAKYMAMAINAATSNFYSFLVAHDSHGVLQIDRVDQRSKGEADQYKQLADRFQRGLSMPGGETFPIFERVVMFGMTNNNSSHLSSAADIALGSLCVCVNAATGHTKSDTAARDLMKLVDPLFRWREFGHRQGYSQYPKTFKAPTVARKYDDMKRALLSYLD